LLTAVAAVVFVWLGILPRIGRTPRVQAYIERNEHLGIDPSVKFYSELPVMPAIIERVESARRGS
jgi:hypothetical protein